MHVFFRKTIGGLIILMLSGTALNSHSQTSNAVSLQTLITAAQAHMPVIAQKQALINSSDAQTRFVRNSFLPSATVADEVSVGTDNSLPGSYLSFGIVPSTSSGIHANDNFKPATGNIGILYSQYDLEDFGLKKAEIQNAQSGANLSKADLAREAYLLKWQVSKLYFSLVKNLYQLEIDSQNVKRYEDIYQVIQAVTISGIKPGADSSLAMAELSKSRITYNQTAGQVKQLQQEISYLSGVPAGNITIDTARTNSEAAAQGITGNVYDNSVNPVIDYYEKQRELFLSTEDLVKKSYLPKILLTGTVWARGSSIDFNNDYKSLAMGLGYQRADYMLGVTFVYDLFDPLHRKDKAAAAHYQTIASDDDLQQQKLDMQNVNYQADVAINTSYKNLQEEPVQIRSSQDAYNQKVAQYKAGIINLVDLTNASFVLYRAQTDYVQTLSDWFLANLDKAASSGGLDTFIQSVK